MYQDKDIGDVLSLLFMTVMEKLFLLKKKICQFCFLMMLILMFPEIHWKSIKLGNTLNFLQEKK